MAFSCRKEISTASSTGAPPILSRAPLCMRGLFEITFSLNCEQASVWTDLQKRRICYEPRKNCHFSVLHNISPAVSADMTSIFLGSKELNGQSAGKQLLMSVMSWNMTVKCIFLCSPTLQLMTSSLFLAGTVCEVTGTTGKAIEPYPACSHEMLQSRFHVQLLCSHPVLLVSKCTGCHVGSETWTLSTKLGTKISS